MMVASVHRPPFPNEEEKKYAVACFSCRHSDKDDDISGTLLHITLYSSSASSPSLMDKSFTLGHVLSAGAVGLLTGYFFSQSALVRITYHGVHINWAREQSQQPTMFTSEKE